MDLCERKLFREVQSQLDSLMVIFSSTRDFDLADKLLLIKGIFEKRHSGVKNGESKD